jgi:prolipoprotein diacylglyceryltransferase
MGTDKFIRNVEGSAASHAGNSSLFFPFLPTFILLYYISFLINFTIMFTEKKKKRKKEISVSWTQWCMAMVLALRRLRQEDHLSPGVHLGHRTHHTS